MQFRLGNTGWRGLRLTFVGSLRDAYLAFAPLYLPLIAMVTVSLLIPDDSADDTPADKLAKAQMAMWIFAPMVVVTMATPWFLAMTKRYQHRGYRIANHLSPPGAEEHRR